MLNYNLLIISRNSLSSLLVFKKQIPLISATKRYFSSITSNKPKNVFQVKEDSILINGTDYERDEFTNVTKHLLKHLGKNLHNRPGHPLSLVKRRIVDFFYKEFPSRTRSPLFTIFDNLEPVVSVEQNYDSLLVPLDHPSRKKSDSYYLNNNILLRAHTSAHQHELIKMGMNNFLVIGDVYRRDEIDRSHYPVFHQVEGVRICTCHDLIKNEEVCKELPLFEEGKRDDRKQELHTMDAVIILERELKSTLTKLVESLFGKDTEIKWTDSYFPFTHPSWELEIKFKGEWLELLGCGIMEQKLLTNAGAGEKIGWAFGIGLERLAMKMYQISDIRTFWNFDSGFLYQFQKDDPYKEIEFKEVSNHPQCIKDVSFWLPTDKNFTSNDFYDLVRAVGSNLVEQVSVTDEFYHEKKKLWSQTYRIVYRHMQKALTNKEVRAIHQKIEEAASSELNVVIR